MISWNLCDYSNAYILVSGTLTIEREGDNDAAKRTNGGNKGAMLKKCAPFSECISNTNNEKNIDVVTPLYNLIEYGICS